MTQTQPSESGDGQRAYAALRTVVPRLSALIRSIKRPATPALGEWNVGDVAVHLAHVWETLPALASGERESPLQHVDELSDLTTSLVRSETRPDLVGVADRIDAAAAAFLTTTTARSSDTTTPWLVEGIQASTPTFACHLLNESLIHGYDIARAERAHWVIPSAHAALALTGFMFPWWEGSTRGRWSTRRKRLVCERPTRSASGGSAGCSSASTTAPCGSSLSLRRGSTAMCQLIRPPSSS
jgi:hypothetical protein